MTTSPHLGFDLIDQSQAQKEVTANEALSVIDALLNTGVADKDLNAPPASPTAGTLYIVGAAPSGAWSGKALQLTWFDQVWRFLAPREGLTLWVNDENLLYTYDGAAWAPSVGTSFSNLSGLGIGAAPDAANKLVVASDAVLFNTATGSARVKVNKSSSSATASHLFQDGYSGRAEFGLIGNDDFSLKVSPDGTTFVLSFVVDRVTGNLDVKQQFSASGSSFKRMALLKPGGSFRPQSSGGCADVAVLSLGANLPDIATFNFNASTQQYAQASLPMPKNWNEGTITAQFLWSHAAASGAYGVLWNIAAVATGDLDAIGIGFGAAVSVLDTGGTADTLYVSPETAVVTVAGSPIDGDTLWLKISRVAADASDTLAVDARLHAVRLFYTQAGLGDE